MHIGKPTANTTAFEVMTYFAASRQGQTTLLHTLTLTHTHTHTTHTRAHTRINPHVHLPRSYPSFYITSYVQHFESLVFELVMGLLLPLNKSTPPSHLQWHQLQCWQAIPHQQQC